MTTVSFYFLVRMSDSDSDEARMNDVDEEVMMEQMIFENFENPEVQVRERTMEDLSRIFREIRRDHADRPRVRVMDIRMRRHTDPTAEALQVVHRIC